MAEEIERQHRPRVPVPEDDAALLAQCDVETMRSGGPGGQHANKTESAVRLRHRPTGIVVRCESERGQISNRRLALKVLRERLARYNHRRKKRLPTGMPRAAREKRVHDKKRRKRVKQLRARPDDD